MLFYSFISNFSSYFLFCREEEYTVTVRFKAVGSAPILRTQLFKISAAQRFETVVKFLRARLRCSDTDSVFLYVNSVFAPSLDEVVGNLYNVRFFFPFSFFSLSCSLFFYNSILFFKLLFVFLLFHCWTLFFKVPINIFTILIFYFLSFPIAVKEEKRERVEEEVSKILKKISRMMKNTPLNT
jgi:hypothetical protein